MQRNIQRVLAALLCLSCLVGLPACKSSSNHQNDKETDAVTDGTAYEYSAGGKVLSAVTYEGGAEVSRIEYDYWPSGSVQTITFTEEGKPVETWNYIYGDDGVTLRSRARSYTEDEVPCSDIYEYDESGKLQKLSTYEDNVYCGSFQYTYNENGETSYSCQVDANDDVINYTEYVFNDDGTTRAGYYYEYGSLARYWINTYENDVIASVTFYTSKDAVLSETKYEYNSDGKVSRMLFYDAEGIMVSYMESLYNDAGVHYKDIYYKDGQPVYGYNYTEEGISTYFEY
ncbi:hypothetical protein IMSAG013_00960 [Clostridiales bacterium]|nr:hypothetical protein IMSAG013_00960 [Clostridiales bacterium]